MSLEDFLSASYALLAEEKQRIDPFKDLLTVARSIEPQGGSTVRTTVAANNEQSYAALGAMMSGVKR